MTDLDWSVYHLNALGQAESVAALGSAGGAAQKPPPMPIRCPGWCSRPWSASWTAAAMRCWPPARR